MIKFNFNSETFVLFLLTLISVCDECDKPCLYGDCPEHGLLEWISDCKGTQQETPVRAASLPSDLCLMPSGVVQGQIGVFTKEAIGKRVVFGPFKGQKIPAEELDFENKQNFVHMWDVSLPCKTYL